MSGDDSLKKRLEKEGQEKKEQKSVNLVVEAVPYLNKFVNESRPLPSRNTAIPSGWEQAALVKQISTYSKKFLRDINDPKMRNKQLLVGKH
jgi:hypothetical protein